MKAMQFKGYVSLPFKNIVLFPVLISLYMFTISMQNMYAQGNYNENQLVHSGFLYSVEDMTVGPNGNVYLSIQKSYYESYVVKLDPAGNILYEHRLEGRKRNGVIAVDNMGCAYVAGIMEDISPCGINSEDAFIIKLSNDGESVIYTSCVGAYWVIPEDIAVDDAGQVYIGGTTSNQYFPTTSGAFQPVRSGSRDGFVVKLSADGSTLLYSTFMGGSGYGHGTVWREGVTGIDVDDNGIIHVIAEMYSNDFPTTPDALDPTHSGRRFGHGGFGPYVNEGVYMKIDPRLSGEASVIYSTYLPANGPFYTRNLRLDPDGHAVICGYSNYRYWPTSDGAYETEGTLGYNIMIARFAADGQSFANSTYFSASSGGGSVGELFIDDLGNVYITGYTLKTDITTTIGAFDRSHNGGYYETFAFKMNPDFSKLIYSTLIGSRVVGPPEPKGLICVDGMGQLWVGGVTKSPQFPSTVNGPFESTLSNTGYDAFVTAIELPNPETEAGTDVVVQPENLDESGMEITGAPVTLTFDEVTTAGQTTVEVTSTSPELPVGFSIGDDPIIFNIATTANYNGNITIGIDYSQIEYENAQNLSLFHYESDQWIDVTTFLDEQNHIIYGEISSLSPFAVLENLPPAINDIIGPNKPVSLGSPVSLSIEYTDPELKSALINWGNDYTEEIKEGFNGTSITFNNTYTVPGVFTVSITLTDQADNVSNAKFNYIVVYDPDGGFVTGGGWINSPLEAYVADPTLEGKANFGFVSKYKKGTTIPTGNTEFQFKAGDLNFNSYVYDWLVIAGSKAKFKGKGTINGTGTYGFMLSALDADLTPSSETDKFRIKIWDIDSEALIYDNQIGDADDADATTEIGGGSIVIHTKEKLKSATVVDPKPVINIYPNPFDNSIFLDLYSETSCDIIIDMVDMNGRVIEYLYTGVIAAEVEHRFEFNSKTDLTPGTYMLRIRTEDGEPLGREIIIKR